MVRREPHQAGPTIPDYAATGCAVAAREVLSSGVGDGTVAPARAAGLGAAAADQSLKERARARSNARCRFDEIGAGETTSTRQHHRLARLGHDAISLGK
jgi:hypothetical protein